MVATDQAQANEPSQLIMGAGRRRALPGAALGGTSAANPKFAHHCRTYGCELRVQSGTGIIELLVSFDSEVRMRTCRKGYANFGIGTLGRVDIQGIPPESWL
jgi:hypothetical protein